MSRRGLFRVLPSSRRPSPPGQSPGQNLRDPRCCPLISVPKHRMSGTRRLFRPDFPRRLRLLPSLPIPAGSAARLRQLLPPPSFSFPHKVHQAGTWPRSIPASSRGRPCISPQALSSLWRTTSQAQASCPREAVRAEACSRREYPARTP